MPDPVIPPPSATTGARSTGSSAVGGALGVIAVVIMQHTSVHLDVAEAAMLTGSLGIVFSFAERYLPRPKWKGDDDA